VTELLANVGKSVESFWQNLVALIGFIGLTLEAFFATLLRPARWRVTSLVANLQQIGLNAVPIIAMLTFMVGRSLLSWDQRYSPLSVPVYLPFSWWCFHSCANLPCC
jgi:ABC-type transporter Mla maintaining outer membrane lipid asymmetry permease subunit MlaE